MDLKIYMDTDGDLMLSRKIYKFFNRGIPLEVIMDDYFQNDKKNNEKWVFS